MFERYASSTEDGSGPYGFVPNRRGRRVLKLEGCAGETGNGPASRSLPACDAGRSEGEPTTVPGKHADTTVLAQAEPGRHADRAAPGLPTRRELRVLRAEQAVDEVREVPGLSAVRSPVTRRQARLTSASRRGPGSRRRTRRLAGLLVAVTSLAIPGFALAASGPSVVRAGTLELRPGSGASGGSGLNVQDGAVTVGYDLSALPVGGPVYVAVQLRSSAAGGYYAQVRVMPDGQLRLGVVKRTGSGQAGLGVVPVPGRAGAGTLWVQAVVSGANPVSISARAWQAGGAVPGWQYSVTDASPAAGTDRGAVSASTYLSAAAAGPLQVRFSGLDVADAPAGAGQAPAPSASGTATTAAPTTSTPASPAPAASSPRVTSPTATTPSSPASSGTGTPRPPTPTDTAAGGATSFAGFPTARTTGVRSGRALKVHQGDLNLTTPGQVVQGLDIHGYVNVTAPNVTIRDSIVRGGTTPTRGRGLIRDTTASATNLVVEDTELAPDRPSVYLDGLQGWNFTARRLDIHGTVDGVKIHGNNVRVESSWIHDLVAYDHDPAQNGGPSHNDGVQILGGTGIVLTGNSISGGPASGIQVTQSQGPVRGLVIEGNFIDRGTCAVKLQNAPLSTLGPVVARDNRIGSGVTIAGCGILRTGATVLQESGNAWADTAKAVTARVWG